MSADVSELFKASVGRSVIYEKYAGPQTARRHECAEPAFEFSNVFDLIVQRYHYRKFVISLPFAHTS